MATTQRFTCPDKFCYLQETYEDEVCMEQNFANCDLCLVPEYEKIEINGPRLCTEWICTPNPPNHLRLSLDISYGKQPF